MDSEYQILTHLEKNGSTSQRRIAHGTGLSVGTVNLMLKRMVRKGLVKIERLNARTLRYIITPKGMAEKTRLVYQYIRSSYRQISRIHQALEQVLHERNGQETLTRVIFYGPEDEILEILKTAAGNLNLKYAVVHTKDELVDMELRDGLMITWDAEGYQELDVDNPVVNILERL